MEPNQIIEREHSGEPPVPACAERHEHQNRLVAVLVNGHTVNVLGQMETGREIKTAAIEQGVGIRLDFILTEELPDGGHETVGDHDKVELREHMQFVAHEPQVIVSVNEQPVKLQGHSARGAEIKAAAIAQGVIIQANFVLQEELPNGNSRIVGDGDRVHLRQHLRFTVIAPDDNS